MFRLLFSLVTFSWHKLSAFLSSRWFYCQVGLSFISLLLALAVFGRCSLSGTFYLGVRVRVTDGKWTKRPKLKAEKDRHISLKIDNVLNVNDSYQCINLHWALRLHTARCFITDITGFINILNEFFGWNH